MKPDRPLLVERHGPVLRLVLARPSDLNALNAALVSALDEAAAAAAADDATRVVVITGAGRAFCAGADLKEVGDAAGDRDAMHGVLSTWRRAFERLESLPKPVIAAVNGAALAGGLELALACDVIVAARSAKLGDVHARFGLVPGGGGSQRLPQAIGTRRARWLMYTGDTIDAEEALRIGLVQAVFDDAGFGDEVLELAARIARGSSGGLAFMKRMSSSAPADHALDLELEGTLELLGGSDAREGIAAFREHREPQFHAAEATA